MLRAITCSVRPSSLQVFSQPLRHYSIAAIEPAAIKRTPVEFINFPNDTTGPKKERIAWDIKDVLETSNIILIFQHNSLNSREWLALRKKLKAKQWHASLFPNKFLKVAITGTRFAPIMPFLNNQIVLIHTPYANVNAILKQLDTFGNKLLLLSMYTESTVLNTDMVKEYLTLPHIESLYGDLLSLLTADSNQLVAGLQKHQNSLVESLSHYVATQEKINKKDPSSE